MEAKAKRLGGLERALRALAVAVALIGAPAVAPAQEAATVKFVQQRGLLYIPIDDAADGGRAALG
jgi:hypothetical protein